MSEIHVDWPKREMQRKTYGRIFVEQEEHVQAVIDLIHEIDDFEASYLPEDLVTVYREDAGLVYLHKFEMCMNTLAKACMNRGIWIWAVDGARDYQY